MNDLLIMFQIVFKKLLQEVSHNANMILSLQSLKLQKIPYLREVITIAIIQLFDVQSLEKLNLLIVADRGITHAKEQLLKTNAFQIKKNLKRCQGKKYLPVIVFNFILNFFSRPMLSLSKLERCHQKEQLHNTPVPRGL